MPPSTSVVDIYYGTILQLSWEEPYAPSLYPVTAYHILITYGSNVLVNSTFNSSSFNSSHLHYDIAEPQNYTIGEVIEFALSAISILGSSNISTEAGMFSRSKSVHGYCLLYDTL